MRISEIGYVSASMGMVHFMLITSHAGDRPVMLDADSDHGAHRDSPDTQQRSTEITE
jgi:hypothetical protein